MGMSTKTEIADVITYAPVGSIHVVPLKHDTARYDRTKKRWGKKNKKKKKGRDWNLDSTNNSPYSRMQSKRLPSSYNRRCCQWAYKSMQINDVNYSNLKTSNLIVKLYEDTTVDKKSTIKVFNVINPWQKIYSRHKAGRFSFIPMKIYLETANYAGFKSFPW